MTAIHETAYPRLKPNPSTDELEKNFKPTYDEIFLMEDSTKSSLSDVYKLGFILTLKCFQCLGYVVNIQKIPEVIVNYISQAMGIQKILDLNAYSPSAKKRHRKIILKYLDISDDRKKQRIYLKECALKSASFKESLADIINDMIETLVKERFELPGFSTWGATSNGMKSYFKHLSHCKITNFLINVLNQYSLIKGKITIAMLYFKTVFY